MNYQEVGQPGLTYNRT